MDTVPDEMEGGAVDLRDEADAADPQPAAPPDALAAQQPVRALFIDAVLEGIAEAPGLSSVRLAEFLDLEEPGQALKLWFDTHPALKRPYDAGRIIRALDRDIAEIDGLMSKQVDACLHHPRFQRLEAAWRGVAFLVDQSDAVDGVKIRVLNVSWSEICRDLERAIEFDQSQLFKKIYSQEFGMPGGEPYGVLIGDYEVMHKRDRGHPTDDVAALTAMSQVAAAAFAPFIVGCAPPLLGIDNFRELGVPINISSQFRQVEYARWQSFREKEDSRFVGMVLPRVLMRLPYCDDGSRIDGFRYREDVSDPQHEDYLWGTACFAFASVLINAFAESSWFTDIRGVRRDEIGCGLVVGLPVQSFGTDIDGIAIKYSTDVSVTEHLEKELGELGLIPLCKCKDTEYSVFYGNESLQRAKEYDRRAASVNARLSIMLQYLMCVGRFAHYIKVIGRDKVGSFTTAEECRRYLRNWLLNYCTGNDDGTPAEKARYPLREGEVEVRETPGKPGVYDCTIYLKPHAQLDQVLSSFKLVTEVAAPVGT